MWLKYGLASDNTLVGIEAVARGKTNLQCPYCGGLLTAKKGKIKEAHFAHTETTCYLVANRSEGDLPTLPLYDHFNIWLTGRELTQLQLLWNDYGKKGIVIQSSQLLPGFLREGLLTYNGYRRPPGYQFTSLGKIPVGALSLRLFNQVQEPLLLEKLRRLEAAVENAFRLKGTDLQKSLTDLRLYRSQLQRVLSETLYYLEVEVQGKVIYKIGVTSRPIGERVEEIRRSLLPYLQGINIKVLGVWEHRGNVEKYFKYRYRDFNYPIGTLREFFRFDEPKVALSVWQDLQRSKPKILSEVEQAVLEGQPSLIEQEIAAFEGAQSRSAAIRRGMESVLYWGGTLGRPKGVETEGRFLAKPSSVRVIRALEKGLSLRKAAAEAGVSVNTVRKVKAIFDQVE